MPSGSVTVIRVAGGNGNFGQAFPGVTRGFFGVFAGGAGKKGQA